MTEFQGGVWTGMALMAVLSIPGRIVVDALVAWWKRRKAVAP